MIIFIISIHSLVIIDCDVNGTMGNTWHEAGRTPVHEIPVIILINGVVHLSVNFRLGHIWIYILNDILNIVKLGRGQQRAQI